jgi:hypothetical protein
MSEGNSKPVFYSTGADPQPIEWTPENEYLFLSGFYMVQTMTKAEFEAMYPPVGEVPERYL